MARIYPKVKGSQAAALAHVICYPNPIKDRGTYTGWTCSSFSGDWIDLIRPSEPELLPAFRET